MKLYQRYTIHFVAAMTDTPQFPFTDPRLLKIFQNLLSLKVLIRCLEVIKFILYFN